MTITTPTADVDWAVRNRLELQSRPNDMRDDPGRYPESSKFKRFNREDDARLGLVTLIDGREPYRFACGHLAYRGTQDGELCYGCWTVAYLEERRLAGQSVPFAEEEDDDDEG